MTTKVRRFLIIAIAVASLVLAVTEASAQFSPSFPAFIQSGAGAVSRAWLSKARDVVNVNDFSGADAGAQLAAAIAAVPNGGTIDARTLTGTLASSATVTIGKPVQILWGDAKLVFATSPGVSVTAGGAGTRIIGTGKLSEWNTAATSNFVVVALTQTADVVIEGLYITGNGVGTDPVVPAVGIDIDRSNNNEVTRNRFNALNINVRLIDTVVGANNPRGNKIHHNMHANAYGPVNGGYGILHVRGLENQIDHETMTPGPFGRHGIYVSAGSRKTIVDHNIVTGAILAGITGNSGVVVGETISDVIIDSNVITGPAGYTAFGYGIGLTGGITNSQITNNVVKAASNDGMNVQPASGTVTPSALVIANNQISGSELQCMSLYGLQTSTIIGNRCGGNGLDTGAHGPLIEYDVGNNGNGPALNNTFVGNTSDSTVFRYGIQLDATSGLNRVIATRGIAMSRERVNDLSNGTNGYNMVNENVDGVQVLAAAATLTVNAGRGSIVSVSLTTNITTVATVGFSPVKGAWLEFIFTQDGTGGRTVAFDSTFKNAWVNTGNTAGKISSIRFVYDGSFWQQSGAQVAYH